MILDQMNTLSKQYTYKSITADGVAEPWFIGGSADANGVPRALMINASVDAVKPRGDTSTPNGIAGNLERIEIIIYRNNIDLEFKILGYYTSRGYYATGLRKSEVFSGEVIGIARFPVPTDAQGYEIAELGYKSTVTRGRHVVLGANTDGAYFITQTAQNGVVATNAVFMMVANGEAPTAIDEVSRLIGQKNSVDILHLRNRFISR